jgi:hypothetical protein
MDEYVGRCGGHRAFGPERGAQGPGEKLAWARRRPKADLAVCLGESWKTAVSILPTVVSHRDSRKYKDALVVCRLSEFANLVKGE